ncbi:MAG: phosphoribosyltransferase [Halobacteriaceae archaeon]
MFENRTRAGDRLAEQLREAGVDVDLVLAIPRGALPVGRAVADAFGVPLDVVAAKKLGAPGNPELAIGAVASDGSEWLNERLVDDLGIDGGYVDRERSAAAETAREKADRYRRGRPPLDLAGKRVAIVDDGVATGATMHACIAAARNAGAERVVVAVPVGAPDSLAELAGDADEVVSVERPARFGAVGQFYRQFEQVSDEEALAYLE